MEIAGVGAAPGDYPSLHGILRRAVDGRPADYHVVEISRFRTLNAREQVEIITCLVGMHVKQMPNYSL